MTFIEKIEQNILENPNAVAVKSFQFKKGITYHELDIYSGSVYAWLKSHGIGKEDMVMILLPRGVRVITALVGVLRAGAAFVICEEGYSSDRVEFIKNDCRCCITIDTALYEEMMKIRPLDGYEKTDPHDACFAVYTSGSTGNPKGVLHEYGKLTQIPLSMPETQAGHSSNPIHVIAPPFQFIAALISTFNALYKGSGISIMDYDQLKDIEKMSRFLDNEGVSEVFLPFSVAKKYKNISKNVATLYLGGEAINNFYAKGPEIYNVYASSESGTVVSFFKIDKPYNVIPAGKNNIGKRILIVDEEGNSLSDGQIGEICIENEYTRGYINLPEKTEESFRDGFYHMKDLGYINENGDLCVYGRVDDMIKIDGNRVEPGEIESALKKVLEVEAVIVKGFKEQDRSFLCAYLIREELERKGLADETGMFRIDHEKLREKLLEKIPYYMIPVYYSVIEKVPVNANGKIDKKQLPKPQISVYRVEYKAPANEVEAYFCQLFGKVLGIGKISTGDDFYHIGGSSLSSIELVGLCRYENITTGDIFKYRTPEKLAAYYKESPEAIAESIGERNKKALKREHALTVKMKQFMAVQQLNTDSTVWNIPVLLKMDDNFDAHRLAEAMDRVLMSHPVFSTVLKENADGTVSQKYVPERYEKTSVVEIGEKDFKEIVLNIDKAYAIFDELLYRKTIYQVGDSVYMYFGLHHIITDGESISLVLKQITECYFHPETQIPEDYYYYYIDEYEKSRNGKEYNQVINEYENLYQQFISDGDYTKILKPDYPDGIERKIGSLSEEIPVDMTFNGNSYFAGIGGNEFFMAAYICAAAIYENKNRVGLKWISNSRNTKVKQDVAGLLIRSLPLYIDAYGEITLESLLEQIKAQVNFGLSNCDVEYRYTEELYDAIFIYQGDYFALDAIDGVNESIHLESNNNEADSLFELSVYRKTGSDNFYAWIEYSASHYKEESMKKFMTIFRKTAMIMAASKQEKTIKEIISGVKAENAKQY